MSGFDLTNRPRVRTTEYYETQFPLSIRRNDGKPLVGNVRRVTRDGCVVVRFDNHKTESTLDPVFIEPNPE